ncbi:putative peroxisomal coenzyme A diphosphatase precursor [Podospora fimiseda]|uniref:Peroxisomal coenzyme A diphosphatase n=1 Tax=Podospora fimiseda TaxID=252190 RepID=A0AAN7BY37_9PEZI|nr:putative peroxisomal coenzyme A diphosphatase precursor [Podospora fimiseda]
MTESVAAGDDDQAAVPSQLLSTSSTSVSDDDQQQQQQQQQQDNGSYWWDYSTMAPLNSVSAAAVARLRAYNPPSFPLWDRLPVSRRAAVLLLLYADKKGDLRVVITMRAASLRSFSGHAALPGGKADSKEESPYQIARREAWEEIGLPMDDNKIPAPFRIEHLCYLPMNLARTELVVRPCVALLHTNEPPVPVSEAISSNNNSSLPTAEQSLIPRLDPKEVAAVFSAPFHNFLRMHDETPAPLPEGNWYEGSWTEWHEEPWRMHFFYVPVTDQTVAKPKVRDGGLAALAEDSEEQVETGRYKVWGMTARILVDAATVAYGEKPEFESNSHFGDERMIEGLDKLGRLGEKKRRESVLTGEDLKKAAKEMDKKSDGGGGEGSKM